MNQTRIILDSTFDIPERVRAQVITVPLSIHFGGETLIDLTMDSVTPEALKKGVTAHAADGSRITGTMAPPELVQDATTKILTIS